LIPLSISFKQVFNMFNIYDYWCFSLLTDTKYVALSNISIQNSLCSMKICWITDKMSATGFNVYHTSGNTQLLFPGSFGLKLKWTDKNSNLGQGHKWKGYRTYYELWDVMRLYSSINGGQLYMVKYVSILWYFSTWIHKNKEVIETFVALFFNLDCVAQTSIKFKC